MPRSRNAARQRARASFRVGSTADAPSTLRGLRGQSRRDTASGRELADILRSLDVTVLMVTHDLPYALELCPRSVVLSNDVIAVDGRTRNLLCDEDLMRGHRLELPFGFDPRSVTVEA